MEILEIAPQIMGLMNTVVEALNYLQENCQEAKNKEICLDLCENIVKALQMMKKMTIQVEMELLGNHLIENDKALKNAILNLQKYLSSGGTIPEPLLNEIFCTANDIIQDLNRCFAPYLELG